MSSEYHRFRAWEYCYHEFNEIKQWDNSKVNLLALNLDSYLASFGMMRGSTFLHETNYKIHEDILLCLFQDWNVVKKLRELAQNPTCHNLCDCWPDIENLKVAFRTVYKKAIKKIPKIEDMEMTVTLFTKILMGTLGCTVAYDKYLIRSLKAIGGTGSFGKKSMLEICKYYDQYDDIIRNYNKIKSAHKLNALYPPMRVLDMILWQYGCELDELEKAINDNGKGKGKSSLSVNNLNVKVKNGKSILLFSLPVNVSLKDAIDNLRKNKYTVINCSQNFQAANSNNQEWDFEVESQFHDEIEGLDERNSNDDSGGAQP